MKLPGLIISSVQMLLAGGNLAKKDYIGLGLHLRLIYGCPLPDSWKPAIFQK